MAQIRTVLVIDDDKDDQFVFIDAMNSVDPSVEVRTASDGLDALEKLGSSQISPELIFLDLNMPRMDGKTFLQELHKNPAAGQIPVIVYSTSSNPSDIEETKALGAQRFITKPNSYDELCRVLGSTVNGVY